jgi:hypothetical protein
VRNNEGFLVRIVTSSVGRNGIRMDLGGGFWVGSFQKQRTKIKNGEREVESKERRWKLREWEEVKFGKG